ncbi:MAG: phenylphosphate carboxylase subunit gamma [Chloroflexi bacterium]|nr:phenylphosphate carboxylase subunit gamma [Chloroflexota bacterium]
MKKEYLTYVRQYSDLAEGEREIFVKDLAPGPRKYDTKRVRAKLARAPQALPDGDVLWVRSETGVLDPQPWALQVLEELPPFVAGQPWSDVFACMNKAR